MTDPMPDPVLDPGEWGPYQDALGGQPLDLSAAEINATQVSRLRLADEYISTDYLSIDDDDRYEIDCYGAICTGEDEQVWSPDAIVPILSPDYEAVVTRGGASIAYVEGGDERNGEDWFALSGWLDHTVFFAEKTMRQYAGGLTLGVRTGSAPLTGSAAWDGVMIGVSTDEGYGVIGNATLTADFASETLNVAFTDIHRSPGLLPTDGDLPVPLPDIQFDDVPVLSGGFFGLYDEQAGNFIEGNWYGPNHVEAGGIFEHGSREISGSFGVSR